MVWLLNLARRINIEELMILYSRANNYRVKATENELAIKIHISNLSEFDKTVYVLVSYGGLNIEERQKYCSFL